MVLGLAALLGILASVRGGGEASAGGDDVRALRQEVAGLRSELRQTRATPRILAPESPQRQTPTSVLANPVDPEPRSSESSTDSRLRDRQTPERIVGRVRTAFSAERKDPSWSWSAEEQVEEVARAASLRGSHLLGVDCRETACEVEATHESHDDHDAFVTSLRRGLGWQDQSGLAWIDPASGRSVLFITRSGHPLPGGSEEE